MWHKISIIGVFLILITLIGFSRVYLGVHWASDVVMGSMLGGALLLATVIFFQKRCGSICGKRRELPKNIFYAGSIGIFFFEIFFIGSFYLRHPLEFIDEESFAGILDIPKADRLETIISESSFPKFSRSTVGKKMEPVSLIVVGSKESLLHTFQKASWHLADIPNTKVLVRSIVAALLNKPYPQAPVTPSFINNEPEIIAFQKPTEKNSIRQRHHTRFWATDFSENNEDVWLGTASFDVGLSHLLSHKILPNIDDERNFIKEDLLKTGYVKQVKEIKFMDAYRGRNQNGDPFFTNGMAYLIYLK